MKNILKIAFGLLALSFIVVNFVPVDSVPDWLPDFLFGSSTISLATIYTPGCPAPTPPTCSDCPTKELGRVRGFWLQKTSYTFANITNPTEWDAAICSGDVIVFPYANGSVDQAEQMSDGYGNIPQDIDSYEYTLNLHEPQYKNNIPFWNDVKRSNNYLVGYKTETLFCLSSVAAKFVPKAPVNADIKSKVDVNLMVKFTQEDLCVPFAGPPAPLFNQCVDC